MKTYCLFFLLLFCLSTGTSCQQESPPTVIADDYWQTADPAEHGLNADTVQLILQRAAGLPNFYALLVIRNQRLLAEAYYKGRSANELFHLRSITKNVTSALTGIAIANGHLPEVDAAVSPYYPDLLQGEKAGITIRHLLNMASGLEWDEDEEIIPLIEHRVSDPVIYLLSKPLASAPAATFNYNSLSPHVVADVISRETAMSLPQLAENELFTPLGIKEYDWTTDPKGAAWGGLGLQFRARDLAKFGQLYLNNGQWEGRQIIPSEWVRQSMEVQIRTSGSSGYSYQWWIADNLEPVVYIGQGYGGQALMVVPKWNMLVVAFQEHFVMGDQHSAQWRNFVDQIFMPLYRTVDE